MSVAVLLDNDFGRRTHVPGRVEGHFVFDTVAGCHGHCRYATSA
jgi:hypothetical protein